MCGAFCCWFCLLGFCFVSFFPPSKFVASVEVFGELHITIKCPTLYYKIKFNSIKIPWMVQVLV